MLYLLERSDRKKHINRRCKDAYYVIGIEQYKIKVTVFADGQNNGQKQKLSEESFSIFKRESNPQEDKQFFIVKTHIFKQDRMPV